jgi:DNA-binding transcriptional LysR family regulator
MAILRGLHVGRLQKLRLRTAAAGVAIMPRSVLNTVRDGESLTVSALAKSRVTTCLVWRKGESPPALNALKAEIVELRKTRKSAG